MTEFTTLLSETFDTAKEEGTPAFEPIPIAEEFRPVGAGSKSL
jgi:hypothetical protein